LTIDGGRFGRSYAAVNDALQGRTSDDPITDGIRNFLVATKRDSAEADLEAITAALEQTGGNVQEAAMAWSTSMIVGEVFEGFSK
jgi:hypothetical protein